MALHVQVAVSKDQTVFYWGKNFHKPVKKIVLFEVVSLNDFTCSNQAAVHRS